MVITADMYAKAAVDWVIDICAENGLRYRQLNFCQKFNVEGLRFLSRNKPTKNRVSLRGETANPKAVVVTLGFDCETMGKRLMAVKNNFYNYSFCRVCPGDRKEIEFFFTAKELDIRILAKPDVEQGKVESIIKRVQKLLALADPEKNPSEAEAMAASMQAQRLLAKYNLDIAEVTGKPKEEEIHQVIADVGTGNKWKYNLADVIARSYCCKCFYVGHEQVVFYGFKSDALVARRVFMYLFNVGNKLARNYVKAFRAEHGYAPDGTYNDYVVGFTDGIDRELSRQCVALALVVPTKVQEQYKDYSKNFGTMNTDVGRGYNRDAYEQGVTDGRLALNAQYIEGGGKHALN